MGSERGRGPLGKASSIRASSAAVRLTSPARALSAECSGFDALGMVKSDPCRTKNRSATARAVVSREVAISYSMRPPAVCGPGKSS